MPLAFVAAIPPSDASAPGSTGNHRPCSTTAAFTSLRRTPGCTRACRSPGSTSSTRFMRERSSVIASAQRDHVRLERRPGAERDRRGRASLVRPREHAGDVLGRLREDDDVGRAPRVVAEVARVVVEHRLARRDRVPDRPAARRDLHQRHTPPAVCGTLPNEQVATAPSGAKTPRRPPRSRPPSQPRFAMCPTITVFSPSGGFVRAACAAPGRARVRPTISPGSRQRGTIVARPNASSRSRACGSSRSRARRRAELSARQASPIERA